MAPQKKAAAADKTKGKFISHKMRPLYRLPPGVTGWSNLITPDQFSEKDALKFKLTMHYTPEQQQALAAKLNALLEDGLYDGWINTCQKNCPTWWSTWLCRMPAHGLTKPSARPTRNPTIKIPPSRSHVNITRATTKRRAANGRPPSKRGMPTVTLLDLEALRLGMGSVVMPMCYISLWMAPNLVQEWKKTNAALKKAGNDPLPLEPRFTFRLEGLTVLKLEQYSGGSAQVGKVEDKELELVDIQDLSDLASFAASTGSKDKKEDADTEKEEADPVIQGLIGRREAYAEFLAALKAKKPPADPPADQK